MKKVFKKMTGWIAVAILGIMGAGTVLALIGMIVGAEILANAGFITAIAAFCVGAAMADVFMKELQSNAEGGDEA